MTNSELLERFRELEARLQKVNTELDGLRVAIKGRTFEAKEDVRVKPYEIGEYVRVKPYEDSDEFAGIVTERTETPKGFVYDVYGKDRAAINVGADMIEKWFPKKGEFCIFWSYNRQSSTIGVFIEFHLDSIFRYKANDINYTGCIPFLSEQQYKRHIGYEK